MNEKKVFRTKSGFCHILPDKIVLSRNGIIGDIATITCGNSISRSLIFGTVLSIAFFYSAFLNFQLVQEAYITVPGIEGILRVVFRTVNSIVFGGMGVFLIYGTLSSLNCSATPIVERAKIKNISFNKGIPGLTRARFEVFFENIHGKTKKRLIMLPGSWSGGSDEAKVACQIMEAEGLIPFQH